MELFRSMEGSQTQKRRRKQEQNINNIPPDDVIFNNILIRLPSKQVARLRRVCKLWNNELSRPSYIKSHLHHSIMIQADKHEEVLLAFYNEFPFDDRRGCKLPFTAKLCTGTVCDEFVGCPIKLPVNSSSYVHGGSYVIGGVNGLICFANCKHDFVLHLWNPSLSALLALPPYEFSPPDASNFETLFRFGFDPQTDDYKVVKLTFHRRRGTTFESFNKKWLHVEVYSMRNGSWRTIDQTPPSHITMIHHDNERYVNDYDGHLHWFGCADHDRRQALVAYDLCLETFGEISLPDSIASLSSYNIIGVLQGKLCVMSCSGNDNHYEVWVMNEYGVAESWVQNHVFSPFDTVSRSIIPFGFTLNNLLIFQPQDKPLALFDPLGPGVTYLNNVYMQGFRTKIVPYVDSLVWVSPLTRS